MKIKILALIVVLTTLLSVNVYAAGYEYTLSPGDGFTSANRGDDLTDIAKKLNMTTKELDKYFDEYGLLYLAVSDDIKTQIKLSAVTDEFSSAVSDISYLSDDQLKEFINAISSDGKKPYEMVTNLDRKYIKVKNTLQDSGGIYTATQYITICDSKTFYLFCYNEGEDTSKEVQKIFKSFSLNAAPDTTVNIFIIAGIAFFTALAFIMIIGIIRSLHNKNINNTEQIGNEL